MLEIIGWISSTAFGVCAAPQAYHSYKEGNTNGLTWSFLLLWYLGEVTGLIYVFPLGKVPLIANYILNIGLTSVILKYKIWPRRKNESITQVS